MKSRARVSALNMSSGEKSLRFDNEPIVLLRSIVISPTISYIRVDVVYADTIDLCAGLKWIDEQNGIVEKGRERV